MKAQDRYGRSEGGRDDEDQGAIVAGDPADAWMTADERLIEYAAQRRQAKRDEQARRTGQMVAGRSSKEDPRRAGE